MLKSYGSVMESDDVVAVLVMLESGLRCVSVMPLRDLGLGFGFCAAAVFFSSFCFFLSCFSLSFFSFSSCLSLIMFIDCSDVSTRANWVGMPTRRCGAGAGLTWREGGVKTDDTVSTEVGRVERRAAAEDNESRRGTGMGATTGDAYRDESSCSWRNWAPSLYVAAVIFVRSKGKIPAFANPAMQFARVVAFSHASRVALA